MRLNLNSILKYFLCLAAALSFAGASATPHACKATNLFYVNGVWNYSPVDAYLSAIDLRRTLAQEGVADAGSLRIRTIWNPGSLVGDVAEVLVSQGELKPGFVLGAALLKANLNQFVRVGLSEVEVLARQSSMEAINNIKSTLRASIENEKAPALVVAHSQGNIFVNRAINQLTTEAGSKDVPGMRNIAVLGLAVAAGENSVGLMSPTRYEYLTAQGDQIIDIMLRSIANVPVANFSAVQWNIAVDDQKPWNPIGLVFSSRHKISDTYLSNTRGINEDGASATFSAEVARKFVKLRNSIDGAWPCITDVFLPTVKQFADGEVAVRLGGRPGDGRAPQGSVQFMYGGGIPFFGGGCNAAPIGPDGYARCTPSFRMAPGTYSVQINVFLKNDGEFTWTRDSVNENIGFVTVAEKAPDNLDYRFKFSSGASPPICYENYPLTDLMRGRLCLHTVSPTVRCEGAACGGNRFYITTTGYTVVRQNSKFGGSGTCSDETISEQFIFNFIYPNPQAYRAIPGASYDVSINPYGVVGDLHQSNTFIYFTEVQPSSAPDPRLVCATMRFNKTYSIRIYDSVLLRYIETSHTISLP